MPQAAARKKADVIARVQREYRALDRTVRRLTPAVLRRPAFERFKREPWTVKDALAHIIAWKRFTALSLRGERRPPRYRGLEVMAANTKLYRDWHHKSAREVVAAHHAVQREVMAALRALPGSSFAARPSPYWPADLLGHSAEHRVRHLERAANTAPTSSTRRRTEPRRRALHLSRSTTAHRGRS